MREITSVTLVCLLVASIMMAPSGLLEVQRLSASTSYHKRKNYEKRKVRTSTTPFLFSLSMYNLDVVGKSIALS